LYHTYVFIDRESAVIFVSNHWKIEVEEGRGQETYNYNLYYNTLSIIYHDKAALGTMATTPLPTASN
jgi:hypothetical protein